jgi:hypothetical protein
LPSLLKEERRRLELTKSEMKKGILQQTPKKFRWSYRNTLKTHTPPIWKMK